MDARELGQKAEHHVFQYLVENGYQILGQNVRLSIGEIDIVAKDRDELVFVEVKSMTEQVGFDPMDHFNVQKQKKLLLLAQAYTSTLVDDIDQRIDLVLVYVKHGEFLIDHYKDVI